MLLGWLALLGYLSPTTLPVVGRWTRSGPPGSPGQIYQIATDAASGAVYAVYLQGDVFKGNIFKTRDSGRSWTPLEPLPDSAEGYYLAVDPTQAEQLLVPNTSGIARSIDGGSTWKEVLSDGYVFQISFDPSGTGTVYAASRSSAFYRSLDHGVSWVALKQPSLPPGDSIVAFAIPKGGPLLFASSTSLFASVDEGNTWSSRVFPASANSLISLVADPVLPGVVYALTTDGLFRSVDGARSWSQVGRGVALTLAIDPLAPTTLYAGDETEIWKSTDAGKTWQMLAFPLPPSGTIRSLALGPVESEVWVGTWGDGLFKSLDGGMSWAEIRGSGSLPGPPVTAIAVDPMSPETFYATTNAGGVSRLYRSEGAGRAWTLLRTETADPSSYKSQPQFTSLVVDPASAETIYGGMFWTIPAVKIFCGGDVIKTTDGGRSWASFGLNVPVTAMTLDTRNPDVLYASYSCNFQGPFFHNGYAIKSTDGGSTWNVLSGFPVTAVNQWLVDTSSATTFAATCDTIENGGVLASSDGGKTWVERNRGLTDLCIFSLAQDSGNPGNLYAGTSTGVFKSADRGMSWAQTGFNGEVRSLVVDPGDSGSLFVGTSGAGVFRSLDGGTTWSTFNDGLTDLSIDALAIDSEGRYLHAATSTGVFDARLTRTRVVAPR